MPGPRGGCRAGEEAGLGSASILELSGLELGPQLCCPPLPGSLDSADTSQVNRVLSKHTVAENNSSQETTSEMGL